MKEEVDVCTLKHFIAHNAHLATENQVRWWIFKKGSNGIEAAAALVKKGGRWYVNIPKLKEWILAGDQNGESKEENELRAIRHGEGHQSCEA